MEREKAIIIGCIHLASHQYKECKTGVGEQLRIPCQYGN